MSKNATSTKKANPVCCYCGKPDNFPADPDSEMRPYGPKGAWLCYGCMMATPEHQAEAERNFVAQLDAAGPVALIDTRDNLGPRPLEGGKQ